MLLSLLTNEESNNAATMLIAPTTISNATAPMPFPRRVSSYYQRQQRVEGKALHPIPENRPFHWDVYSGGDGHDDTVKKDGNGDALHPIASLKRQRSNSTFSSLNLHQLVNETRAQYALPPLRRNKELCIYAKSHAKTMAKRRSTTHSVASVRQLQRLLHSRHVAENISCGDSIRQMYTSILSCESNSRQNVLGNFVEMGAAVVRGTDHKLYLCQVFRK